MASGSPGKRPREGTEVAMRNPDPITQGKEAHMRDERMNATPLRLRTRATQSSSHGRTLAEELIRKARLATAMHLALQAEQRAAGKHTP